MEDGSRSPEPCFYKWGCPSPQGWAGGPPRRSTPSVSRPGRAAGGRPQGRGAGCQSGALSRLPVTPALPGHCLAPVTLGPQPELHRGLGCPGHFRSIPRKGGQLRRSWAWPGPEPDGSGGPVRDELLALLPAAALGTPGGLRSSTKAPRLCQTCLQPCQGFICVYLGGLPRSGVPCEGVCSQTGWRFPHPRDRSWGPRARVNKPQALNPSTESGVLPSSASSLLVPPAIRMWFWKLLMDFGSIPASGRSPGGENGNPPQYSCWRIPWTEEPDRPHGAAKSWA